MVERPGRGSVPARSSSVSKRRGPHAGWALHMVMIAASSSAAIWWGQRAGRQGRSARPASPVEASCRNDVWIV